jgi:cell division protein FtsW
MLLLIPGLGEEINGATRWLNLGPFSFQPAELLKFALVLYLAAWLAERIRTNQLDKKNEVLIPLLIITGLSGVLVAVLQKDLGTMVALASIISCMLFVSGVSMRIYSRFIGLLASAGLVMILLFPHRLERLFTFISPSQDVDGTGYHIDQALIAIGSGGWFGTGLGKSVQVFGYLPEAISDSVFAIVGEQFGFIGSMLILFLYGALAVRLLRIIERAPTSYMRLIGAGMFGWLLAHVFVNVGAMLGLLPLTGIPLPFLSLGGTSLIFITAGFGIMFNISRYTSLAYEKENHGTRQSPSTSHLAGRGRHGGARLTSFGVSSRTGIR